jgi:hypothetical protein
MVAWDHFHPDSAFSPSVSTHYVNPPHWLPLSWAEVAHSYCPSVRNTVLGNGCRWPMLPKIRLFILMFDPIRPGYMVRQGYRRNFVGTVANANVGSWLH